jgi:DNA-binding MarR family transcriptional regulator
MQEIQGTEAKNFGRGTGVSNQSFAVLLALARKPLTDGELGTTFGVNPSELGRLIDRLRKNCLVDAVSDFDERGARQALCLTDNGEMVLLHEMERMCELPER